jgi:hypothetical protein
MSGRAATLTLRLFSYRGIPASRIEWYVLTTFLQRFGA